MSVGKWYFWNMALYLEIDRLSFGIKRVKIAKVMDFPFPFRQPYGLLSPCVLSVYPYVCNVLV